MAFYGEVVLITGDGSGMGQLAALNLADQGARVAALDVNATGLAETIEGRSGIKPFNIDVTDTAAVQDVVRQVSAELGPIDRVYNAAAVRGMSPVASSECAVGTSDARPLTLPPIQTAAAFLPVRMLCGRMEVSSA